MTDAKRLLAEATPLPWQWDGPINEWIDRQDAALIVYAVNRLPDYEAAVETLEQFLRADDVWWGRSPQHVREQISAAIVALARLRETVPS